MTNLTTSAIEQAVQTYLHTMTPEQLAKSDAYFEGGYWLILWNLLFGLGIAALLMRTGWSVKMRQRAEKISGVAFLRTWIYYFQYLVFVSVVGFPMMVYQDYFREHQYGLSNMTFAVWFGEALKGWGVNLVLGGLFMCLLYWVISRLKETWWVWGTLVSTVFMIFSIMIAPVFISPLFNKYTALPAGEVRDSVLAMARANGVPASEVYQFDASKQSKRISANVSGIFGTTRVSLNDNLLKRTSLAEIRHVMGHELGHYALHHVGKFVVNFTLILLAGFYFLSKGLDWYTRTRGQTLGLRGVADVATMPVFIALFSVYMTIATPLMNTIIRTAEAEADLFALNLAREPEAAATVAIQLSEYRKMSPGYWEEVIFYDHPSGENRIRMAMTWKQENLPTQNEN